MQSSLEQSFLKDYTGKSAEVLMMVFESYNLQGSLTLSYNIRSYVRTYLSVQKYVALLIELATIIPNTMKPYIKRKYWTIITTSLDNNYFPVVIIIIIATQLGYLSYSYVLIYHPIQKCKLKSD